MNNADFTKYIAELEEKIGKERVQALRAESIRRGVSLRTILADAITEYARAINKTEHAA